MADDIKNTASGAVPSSAGEIDEPFYERSRPRGDFMVMMFGQTVEQWWQLAPEKQLCEYIDGVIYMPNAATDEHQDVLGFVFFLTSGWRWDYASGGVYFSPGVLRLGKQRNLQPDIQVRPIEGSEDAPAILVVEILSPSTRAHDLGLKARIYQEAGIPEVWFVDMEGRSLRVDQRLKDRKYSTEWISTGIRSVPSLPGFWLDVAWLWDRPLPNALRCLDMILAGPPA